MKSMKSMKFLIILPLIFLNACASVGTTRISGINTTEKPPTCNLDVYSSAKEIKKKYKVACLIDSRTGTTVFHGRNVNEAISQAKPHACKCGADALIIENVDTEGIGFSSWGMGKAIIKAIIYDQPLNDKCEMFSALKSKGNKAILRVPSSYNHLKRGDSLILKDKEGQNITVQIKKSKGNAILVVFPKNQEVQEKYSSSICDND